jgi:UDP-2-acetamido-3-amino-2,3-dideoxy-glucuronate N-acetyltransferase
MNQTKKRVGLIGGGYWGKNLIRDFNSLGVLHTICDVNTDALDKYKELYPGIKLTTIWKDILENKDITSVCISLPADMHYSFAKDALLCGKDVYVEKPITLNESRAIELINIAKQNNLILMVGHLLHYHTHVDKMKNIVESGRIGKIKNIICNRFNLGKFRTTENVLWSFAPHDISVVLSLLSDKLPNRIMCTGNDFINKGVHDITNTVLFFDDIDVYVNINVSWLNPFKEQKMVVVGEKGMIVFDDTLKENKLVIYDDYLDKTSIVPNPNKKIKKEIINVKFEYPLLRECIHFIECCNSRKSPITDGDEGLRVIKVLNASHKSLVDGKEIKIQNYFIHPTATVDRGSNIGEGTKIWHYCHISKNSQIGKNCNIGQNVFVAGGSIIGNNCKIQNNVSVYKGVVLEDNVFLGPSCVLTNDINPRCEYPKNGQYVHTLIKTGSTIGANATIICGNTIGSYAFIGAGSVVTKDVPDYAIMVGNPAEQIGTIDKQGNRTLL